MATPNQLRKQIAALTRLAERDVRLLVAELDDFAARGVALRDVLPLLIDTYGQAASAVTADWYDELREEQAVAGRFRAVPAALPSSTGVPQLVDWAQNVAKDPEAMVQLALGGMQRRIANQSRATVIGSAGYDPRSDGWMRVGDGDNCGFCDMLISRGAVYDRDTVKFGAHDWCNCQAAPSFGRPSDIFDVEAYRQSKRRKYLQERDPEQYARENAAAREWAAVNLAP